MQLYRSEDKIREAGAKLVVVGNGSPSFIEGFREKTGYSGELYTDPRRGAYRALNLRRSVRSSINLTSLGRAFEALRGGYRQTATQGDPWQQGGVFVILPSSEIVYAYASKTAGDHPPASLIMSAINSVVEEGEGART
jgi:hypothetical protein